MRIDPAGVPFVLGALGLAALVALAGLGAWVVLPLLLSGFFLFFFRDPDRATSPGPDEVVAPADGRVVVAGDPEPGAAPPGTWRQISIFLSPLDVHVNRMPVSGRVTRVEYQPGRFLPAYRNEAATENERNEIWIERDGQTIVARQVVGVLARRIVCRVAPGTPVVAGQRFGVMKFGSRMDVFLPPGSDLRVRPGDRTVAGITTLAVLPPAGRSAA
jgi:phosphatidylserine decarboxylase